MVAAPTIAWRSGIGGVDLVIGHDGVPTHTRGGATVAHRLAPVTILHGDECCAMVHHAWNSGVPIGWVEQDGVPPPTSNALVEQVVPTTPHVVLGEWRYLLRGNHYRVVIARRVPDS